MGFPIYQILWNLPIHHRQSRWRLKSSSQVHNLQDPRKGVELFFVLEPPVPPETFLMQKFVAPKSRGAFRRRCCWVLCAVVFHVRYHLGMVHRMKTTEHRNGDAQCYPQTKRGGRFSVRAVDHPWKWTKIEFPPLKNGNLFKRKATIWKIVLQPPFLRDELLVFGGVLTHVGWNPAKSIMQFIGFLRGETTGLVREPIWPGSSAIVTFWGWWKSDPKSMAG